MDSYHQTRLRDLYALVRPLFWLLLIETFVFIVFVILPQSQDVYFYLLEEGFEKNFLTILLLFAALLFLSCSSGIGGKLILFLTDLSQDVPSSGDKDYDQSNSNLNEALAFRKRLMENSVWFLWYFPFISFLIGLYKTIFSFFNEFQLLTLTLTTLSAFLGLLLIYKIRKGLRNYLKSQLSPKLIAKFDGLLNGLSSDEINTKPYTLTGDYLPVAKILCFFFAFTLLLFTIFIILPTQLYYYAGAAPLAVFGLGAWLNLYVGAEMLEHTYEGKIYNALGFTYDKRKYYPSFKFLILLWVCFCSYINDDHPLRLLPESGSLVSNVSLAQNLESFSRYTNQKTDTTLKKTIVFVSVDGGASRTGFFGATMLSVIQDSIPAFKKHIFAYSNISGGALGANIFYSLTQIGIKQKIADPTSHTDSSYKAQTNNFFKRDFLSPAIGTFAFGESVGYFLPFYVEKFDRGVALEKEWIDAWKGIMPMLNNSRTNILEKGAKSVMEIKQDNRFHPVMFINTHEVETGKRAIYSNVIVEDSVFAGVSNLNKMLKKDLPYSSAILLSARFPLISPAAKVQKNDFVKRHYVDGGYFESTGTLTLYESLRALEDSLKKHYNVFVLHLESDQEEEPKENRGVSFLNEFSEIIHGAVNDRSGHTLFAVANLKNYVNKTYGKGHYISLKVGSSMLDVPLNWALSKKAMQKVTARCDSLWKRPELDILKKSLK